MSKLYCGCCYTTCLATAVRCSQEVWYYENILVKSSFWFLYCRKFFSLLDPNLKGSYTIYYVSSTQKFVCYCHYVFSIQTLHTQKKWQPLFLENLIAFAWKVNNNKFWTHFDRMNVASASSQQGPWPPPGGPNSLPGGPHMRPLGPRLSGSNRPPRPFFVREIYKNGYLKRLPYNEKKSSALSKLMKTDR